jgi:hypothetical protein
MPSPRSLVLALVALAFLSACGKKIGDSCQIPSDCSSDADRICDLSAPDGYCTIAGCDFATCPSEAVCVRFYPGADDSSPCGAQTDCAFDEICTVGNRCAQRSSEIRFCMLMCEGDGDCRGGYECRDQAVMMIHGGEPVPDPASGMSDFQPFCAQRKPCTIHADCPVREACDDDTRTCIPRPSCSVDAECGRDPTQAICNTTFDTGGQCVRPCTQQIDCEQNETCNTTTRFCEAS